MQGSNKIPSQDTNENQFSESVELILYSIMPPSFFEFKKVAKASGHAIRTALLFYISAACASFSALFIYYYNLSIPVNTISLTLLPGQTCTVLSPRRGVAYYSTETSENGQFAAPFFTKNECIGNLSKTYKVCDAANRYDYLSVLGVSYPNNLQFYPSGYFSFTPSATLASQITTVHAPSVAFPRPGISKQFQGVSTNWFVHDSKNDSYVEYKNFDLSSAVFDSKIDDTVSVFFSSPDTSLVLLYITLLCISNIF